MLYQDFDMNREHRVQIRREVAHNLLEARLVAVRTGKDAGPGKAISLRSLATRSAAVVVSLFR